MPTSLQIPALHEGVGELCRSDHDLIDCSGLYIGPRHQFPDCSDDTPLDIVGCRDFDSGNDRLAAHQYSIRIGASYIYADSHVHDDG